MTTNNRQAIWKDDVAVCPTCLNPAEINEKVTYWKVYEGEWENGVFYADDWEGEEADDSQIKLFCPCRGDSELDPPVGWDDNVHLQWA